MTPEGDRARKKDVEEGLDALEAAVQAGYTDLNGITRDPDLLLLRGHPRYNALRAKVK
jgi:hypothetical protein